MEKIITDKYYIKGMICSRCLKVLKNELTAIGIEVMDIHLGLVQIKYNSGKLTYLEIENIIKENEFDILKNKESILAEEIKKWIIYFIWDTDHLENLSDFLTEKLHKNYFALSKNFSKTFGQTLERYYTRLKIERVKEWVELDEISFGEMAYRLGYQNLSALSRQFKKETGMTMSTYKELDKSQRIPLDKI